MVTAERNPERKAFFELAWHLGAAQGEEVEAVLRRLPAFGPLFPNLSRLPSTERASIFRLRCQALGIEGVTLHSYRYAWAERQNVWLPGAVCQGGAGPRE